MCKRRFVMGIHSCAYGGWEVSQYVVCKLKSQESWWWDLVKVWRPWEPGRGCSNCCHGPEKTVVCWLKSQKFEVWRASKSKDRTQTRTPQPEVLCCGYGHCSLRFHAVFGGTHVLLEVKTHSCYPNLGKAKRGGGVSCELVSNEYVARKNGSELVLA